MFEYFTAATALRLFEIVVYSSLWIVIGCFVAAIFRRMMGPAAVRRLFGDHTRLGLVTGWLIGMLLPVCSLGVIPIVREMHRAGVKRGTIVTFGLTAPLFNPMSVLYGLTLSDPIAILTFSLCAMIIVSLLGVLWNRIPTNSDDDEEILDEVSSSGIKRTISVFDSASSDLIGPSLVYILIGICASVTLAVLLPHGYLQHAVNRENGFAPILVAAVATPIYSTPLLAMSQIGGMFQHGNSIGAAFSLLILGAGVNVGILAWFGRTYGVKRFIVFYLLLVATTVGLAYLVDKPLYPQGVDPAGHTHAFDVYTNPFLSPDDSNMALAQVRIAEFWASNELGGTYLLGLLLLTGLVFRYGFDRAKLERWYQQVDAKEKDSKLNLEVPSWVLGITVMAGLIFASVAGSYLYYPAPADILPDLYAVNVEAVLSARTKDWQAAEKWIAFCDNLSRRVEVGVYLRNGSVSEFKTGKARVYREKLEDLKMAVIERREANVADLGMDVQNAYRRMRDAFNEVESTE